MTERAQFGPSLRLERERRGISLQDVATQTKISASFFAALERNDLSRWPGGIFRRSFVRSYAQAVGLDADRTVREFMRLFPLDEDGSARHVVVNAASRTPALRLVATSSPSTKGRARSTRRRLATAAVELAAVGGAGAAVGLMLDWFYAWPTFCAGALIVAAANLRQHRKTVRLAAVASPTSPNSRRARHVTKRDGTERQEAGRRRRSHRAKPTRRAQ